MNNRHLRYMHAIHGKRTECERCKAQVTELCYGCGFCEICHLDALVQERKREDAAFFYPAITFSLIITVITAGAILTSAGIL